MWHTSPCLIWFFGHGVCNELTYDAIFGCEVCTNFTCKKSVKTLCTNEKKTISNIFVGVEYKVGVVSFERERS